MSEPLRENAFLRWLRGRDEPACPAVTVGPGDDCAVLVFGGERLLVTCDQLLDGVHIRLAEAGAEAFGFKAMARAVSDIAAMAGEPVAAVVSTAFPKGFAREQAERLHAGRLAASEATGCPVIGGDVASGSGPLSMNVTVLGRCGPWGPVLRSTAREGEAICVTGRLGGSWISGRHLRQLPRLKEARTLAADWQVGAMMDLSDGLAMDLPRLCGESRVAAEIYADAVPVHPDAALWQKAAGGESGAPRRSALAAALEDGEDYELLFTLPPERARRLAETAMTELGCEVSVIGRVVSGAGAELIAPDGSRSPLAGGYEHGGSDHDA
jgi:thiamine-monophosphate kinase